MLDNPVHNLVDVQRGVVPDPLSDSPKIWDVSINILHRDLLIVADIEDPSERAGLAGKADRRVHHVIDVAEEAGLSSVVEDPEKPSFQGLPDKTWENHAVPSRPARVHRV
jgi:hypothetical protein